MNPNRERILWSAVNAAVLAVLPIVSVNYLWASGHWIWAGIGLIVCLSGIFYGQTAAFRDSPLVEYFVDESTIRQKLNALERICIETKRECKKLLDERLSGSQAAAHVSRIAAAESKSRDAKNRFEYALALTKRRNLLPGYNYGDLPKDNPPR